MPEPDIKKSAQATSQGVSSQALSLMKNKYFFSAEGEDEDTLEAFQRLSNIRSGQNILAASLREETRISTTNNSNEKLKLKFCDVLERFLDHFESVMGRHLIVLNRIYERRRLHLGSRDHVTINEVYDNIPTVDVLL